MFVISVIQFSSGKFQINGNAIKEGIKDIHYVKEKDPVFEMSAYNIKDGNNRLKTG